MTKGPRSNAGASAPKSHRRGIQTKADIGQTNIPGSPEPDVLPIQDLTIDIEIQQRARMNDDLIAEYAVDIANWIKSAPITVITDDRDRWVADGFHRVEAALTAGLDTIPAHQYPGARRDALLFAVGANKAHGLRRTNADKRRAVETLLNDSEWSQWSDRLIADRAGVSDKTVAAVRREVCNCGNSAVDDEPVKRLGADGKERTVPTRKPDPKPIIVEEIEGDDLSAIRDATAKLQAKTTPTATPDPAAPATPPAKGPTAKEAMHAAHGVTAALGMLRRFEDALLESDARTLIGELRKALDRLMTRFGLKEGDHA
jgi:ParB-like chromosome segregation protein Spo0J